MQEQYMAMEEKLGKTVEQKEKEFKVPIIPIH